MTQSEALLKKLGDKPIFKLSLGSKELFHSNFLEFLWDVDRSFFIDMIRTLLRDPYFLNLAPSAYSLSREKENFDICIYHVEQKQTKNKAQERVVYDLIIENKVKSIPYKEQLVKYVERVEKKRIPQDPEPKYLLLSLAESFPDKNQNKEVDVHFEIKDKQGRITKAGTTAWKVVNYEDLGQSIFQQRRTIPNAKAVSYIADYVGFVIDLHDLQRAILNTMAGETLFKDYDLFKQYRLHDLYIKLRCTNFMMQLKDRLFKNGIPVEILAANRIREKDRSGQYVNAAGIYLNVNVFNAVGQIGALVWKGKGDIYEVVIQGGQFRHGINPERKAMGSGKRAKLDNMWLRHMNNQRSKGFLTSILGKNPEPSKNPKGKRGSYCEYDDAYIYRYIKCDQMTVDDLFDAMEKDIMLTAQLLKVI